MPKSRSRKEAERPVTPTKAKEILRDGSVRGQPLTPKQKGLFGAVAGKRKR